jgi:hypothetical protein
MGNCSHFPWRTKAGLVFFVEGCALHTSRLFVKLIWSMPYPKREQVQMVMMCTFGVSQRQGNHGGLPVRGGP